MAKAAKTGKTAKERSETARQKDTIDGGRDRMTLPRPTATAARRRRPTSKPAEVVTPSVRRAAERPTKRGLHANAKTSTAHEDKRDSPSETVTDAVPANLKADRNDKKSKGKSTHELEAHPPGKRPSRKSSRGGANHIKPDAPQRRQATRALRSPKNRHAMRGA